MILFSSFGHAANSREQKKTGENGGEGSGIMTGNDKAAVSETLKAMCTADQLNNAAAQPAF